MTGDQYCDCSSGSGAPMTCLEGELLCDQSDPSITLTNQSQARCSVTSLGTASMCSDKSALRLSSAVTR